MFDAEDRQLLQKAVVLFFTLAIIVLSFAVLVAVAIRLFEFVRYV